MAPFADLHATGEKPRKAPESGRKLVDADLYRIAIPRSPRLSPDGEHILYQLETADPGADRSARTLYVVSRTTGNAPARIALGDVRFAFWSGSDHIVAITLTETDECEVRQVAIGGTPRTIGALPSLPSTAALSPDGQTLALTMSVPDSPAGSCYINKPMWRLDGTGLLNGPEILAEFSIATGELIFHDIADRNAPLLPRGLAWSIDSKRIFFSANLHADVDQRPIDTDIHRFSRETGETTALTDRFGPDHLPQISPCGGWIAWLGFDDMGRFHHPAALHLMRTDGTGARILADVRQNVGAFTWDRGGQGLWFSYVRGDAQRLAYTDIDGQITELASGLAPGEGLDPESAISGLADIDGGVDEAIVVIATADDPAALAVVGRDGSIEYLVRPNASWLVDISVAPTTSFGCPSPDGDGCIQAWILLPNTASSSSPAPLILDIHGGPDLAFGDQFCFRFQRYAAEGYAVLLPNYRGSSGTNLSHYDRNWNFPDGELDDILASLDAALAQFPIDASRLFVTGQSAGGALAAWAIGKTNRFAAAAVHSPVINWISHALTHDLAGIFLDRMFDTLPWDDIGSWWRRSPLSLAGQIETPTLIIHGDTDCRTPPGEGIQLYHALQRRGVTTALLIHRDAAHIPVRPSHWIREQAEMLKWFKAHGQTAKNSSK